MNEKTFNQVRYIRKATSSIKLAYIFFPIFIIQSLVLWLDGLNVWSVFGTLLVFSFLLSIVVEIVRVNKFDSKVFKPNLSWITVTQSEIIVRSDYSSNVYQKIYHYQYSRIRMNRKKNKIYLNGSFIVSPEKIIYDEYDHSIEEIYNYIISMKNGNQEST